jgi:hypothetical protein
MPRTMQLCTSSSLSMHLDDHQTRTSLPWFILIARMKRYKRALNDLASVNDNSDVTRAAVAVPFHLLDRCNSTLMKVAEEFSGRNNDDRFHTFLSLALVILIVPSALSPTYIPDIALAELSGRRR